MPFTSTHTKGLGKSDPFVVFTLNGQRVHKSQTKKKTLHPEWNETFSVTVVSATVKHGKPLVPDYVRRSRLVLPRTSKLKSLTGTRLSKLRV